MSEIKFPRKNRTAKKAPVPILPRERLRSDDHGEPHARNSSAGSGKCFGEAEVAPRGWYALSRPAQDSGCKPAEVCRRSADERFDTQSAGADAVQQQRMIESVDELVG